MKNLLTLPLLLSLNLCLAQPQWKFHIAFEDATGAKDTLWMIWDTTATGNINGYDTLLGEGPFNFNYNEFNVWTTNDLGDSTKTVALPYNAISFLPIIKAFNYQYPITIRWDSSLFHAAYLPLPVGYVNRATIGNEYFFGINNDPPLQAFNMLLDNYAEAPAFTWGSQSQFPMGFYVAKDPSISINEFNPKDFRISPNPFSGSITIDFNSNFKALAIETITGQEIFKIINPIFQNSSLSIATDHLDSGIYFLKILTHQKHVFYEKIIKMH